MFSSTSSAIRIRSSARRIRRVPWGLSKSSRIVSMMHSTIGGLVDLSATRSTRRFDEQIDQFEQVGGDRVQLLLNAPLVLDEQADLDVEIAVLDVDVILQLGAQLLKHLCIQQVLDAILQALL